MNIIKLSATPSTNDFLKKLCSTQSVENFTIVIAENQTQGKGQRGNTWNTEPNKNLTFSILLKNILHNEVSIFDLNITVCISIIQALELFGIPKISIKWPNDILSDGKKISGILIENSISNPNSISSIIGIGLNINQTNFKNFPKASSLKIITKKEFDKEEIMLRIIEKIKENSSLLSHKKTDLLWEEYHKHLFRKNIPSVFELPDQTKFMGIIKQVLKNGKLQIQLENDSVKEFELKEVSMIY